MWYLHVRPKNSSTPNSATATNFLETRQFPEAHLAPFWFKSASSFIRLALRPDVLLCALLSVGAASMSCNENFLLARSFPLPLPPAFSQQATQRYICFALCLPGCWLASCCCLLPAAWLAASLAGWLPKPKA